MAAYNFDAGSGTTVTDQAGRGNTLQLTNATWTAQGHTGGAVQFSGLTAAGRIAGPATDLAFTTAFTITAWVNPTALSTGWRTIAGRQLGTGTDNSWFLGHNGATLYFGAGGRVTTTLTAGVWTHVAAVKNGQTLQLYKNGALVASLSTAAGAVATDANEVGVGGDNNGTPLWSVRSTGAWTTCGSTARRGHWRNSERHEHSGAGGGGVPDTLPPVISHVTAAAATRRR